MFPVLLQPIANTIRGLESKLRQLKVTGEELDQTLESLRRLELPPTLETLPPILGFIPKWNEFDDLIDSFSLSSIPPRVEPIEHLPEHAIGALFHSLLSPEECTQIIDLISQDKPDELIPASSRVQYRNCKRLELVCPKLASLLWNRLVLSQHFLFLHDLTDATARYVDSPGAADVEGTWTPVGMNPLIRIIAYEPQGHFSPHFDSHYTFHTNKRTMLTVMLYLTDDFEGGCTEFLHESYRLLSDNQDRVLSPHVHCRIRPIQGTAIVFPHHLLHQGGAVQSERNTKWILRSEVVFERIHLVERNVEHSRAMDLLEQARVAENAEKYEEAIDLYSRAFRLWPSLNQTVH